ncbi:hypothetical protein K431DRAFT_236703, partial [Polychaeton citri CBS 116435]
IYVGITSRTAVLVLEQYILTLVEGRVLLNIICSNYSAKTLIATNVYYVIS